MQSLKYKKTSNKKHSIAAVINFCTNDYRFIRYCIREALKFSKEIIVPVSDHFYDNTPENHNLLEKTIKENPQAKFIKFKYDPKRTISIWRGWQFILRKLKLGDAFGATYWIGYARRLGYKKVLKDIEYVLFLDADEIVDGDRFLKWLESFKYKKYNALKLANFWYWRKPIYQALVCEDSPLMIKNKIIDENKIINHDERNGMYESILGNKKRMVLGLNKKPMIHHYGWAKSKKELFKKVKTWGHSKDRNWEKLILEEFSHPFSGTDFIYKRKFKTVKPFFKDLI